MILSNNNDDIDLPLHTDERDTDRDGLACRANNIYGAPRDNQKRNPESPGKSCKIKYNARCTCPANISTLD